jgi:hypothetical protein
VGSTQKSALIIRIDNLGHGNVNLVFAAATNKNNGASTDHALLQKADPVVAYQFNSLYARYRGERGRTELTLGDAHP